MPTLPTNPQSIGASGHVNDHNTIVTALTAGAYLSGSKIQNASGADFIDRADLIRKVRWAGTTSSINTTSTTYVDATGASLTFTPASNTSSFLVIATICASHSVSDARFKFRVLLGASTQVRETTLGSPGGQQASGTILAVSQPATASSVTYKVQYAAIEAGTVTVTTDGIQLAILEFGT